MGLFIVSMIVFLTYKVMAQGGKLYYFEPGIAEYIVSFAFFYLIVVGIAALVKKL